MHRALRVLATTTTRLTMGLIVTATLASTASCSLMGGNDDEPDQSTSNTRGSIAGTTITLVTHDTFASDFPKKLVKQFEKQTGAKLEIRAGGDAGKLTTSLALNQKNPVGDVAFGVDNTFASRALDEGVFATYAAELPSGADEFQLEGDGAERLAPIDQASVCVNIDTAWFDEKGIEPPAGLDDLPDPKYKDLMVAPGAATSSPGLAFLLATIGKYDGDTWHGYWQSLVENGIDLTEGWTDAYYGGFTGGGDGDRPIVVSYDTSPAFTIDKATGKSTTMALLDTCFRQVEYAGVLENAKNPAGAQAVVDWLLSPEVQAALPDSLYVFPVDDSVELPADWAKFAEKPTDPIEVSADDIAENRKAWLTDWTEIVSR